MARVEEQYTLMFERARDQKLALVRSKLREMNFGVAKIEEARDRNGGVLNDEVDDYEGRLGAAIDALRDVEQNILDGIEFDRLMDEVEDMPIRRQCDLCGSEREWRFEVDGVRYCKRCAEDHAVRPAGKA